MLTTLERDGTESTVIASRSPGSDSVAVSPVCSISSTSTGRASARRSSRESTRSASVTSASPSRNGPWPSRCDHAGGLERREQPRGRARVDADPPRELVDAEALLAVAQLLEQRRARGRPRRREAAARPAPDSHACCAIGNSIALCATACLRCAGDVVRAHVSALRRPRGDRLRLRRRGDARARRSTPSLARAERVQLLPPQRRRRPARVVVSPLGLPHVVPGRARHAHQRGAAVGLPGELEPAAASARREPAAAAARRADRPRRRRSRSPSTASRSTALAGDTIGSALYAAGRRTFSRSFKYHRRRGLMCCAGQCPNCLVAVDGAPGVRACTEPVARGHARRAPQRAARASSST